MYKKFTMSQAKKIAERFYEEAVVTDGDENFQQEEIMLLTSALYMNGYIDNPRRVLCEADLCNLFLFVRLDLNDILDNIIIISDGDTLRAIEKLVAPYRRINTRSKNNLIKYLDTYLYNEGVQDVFNKVVTSVCFS